MLWNLQEAIEYYRKQGAPADQGALISLLREIQRENGGISRGDIGIIAQTFSVKEKVILVIFSDLTHIAATCRIK